MSNHWRQKERALNLKPYKDPTLQQFQLENEEFPALWPKDQYEELKKRKAKKLALEALNDL